MWNWPLDQYLLTILMAFKRVTLLLNHDHYPSLEFFQQPHQHWTHQMYFSFPLSSIFFTTKILLSDSKSDCVNPESRIIQYYFLCLVYIITYLLSFKVFISQMFVLVYVSWFSIPLRLNNTPLNLYLQIHFRFGHCK